MLTLRFCFIFLIVLAITPQFARAQDVTLKDAIKCGEFKRNADGSWYAKSVSLNYGPGKKNQMNLFDTTIKKKPGQDAQSDIFTILNEKCGTGR